MCLGSPPKAWIIRSIPPLGSDSCPSERDSTGILAWDNLSPMEGSTKSKWGHLVVSDSLRPRGLWPTRLLYPWNFPDKSIGVGCHLLFQRIFPTQGSNLGLPHSRQMLYHLSHQGSWVPRAKKLTIWSLAQLRLPKRDIWLDGREYNILSTKITLTENQHVDILYSINRQIFIAYKESTIIIRTIIKNISDLLYYQRASQVAQLVKNPPANGGDAVLISG